MIVQALNQFQGVMGQSIQCDILANDEHNLECIVRVPTMDQTNFVNCMVASSLIVEPATIQINKSSLPLDSKHLPGSLRVESRSQYLLGVTGPDRFKWYI